MDDIKQKRTDWSSRSIGSILLGALYILFGLTLMGIGYYNKKYLSLPFGLPIILFGILIIILIFRSHYKKEKTLVHDVSIFVFGCILLTIFMFGLLVDFLYRTLQLTYSQILIRCILPIAFIIFFIIFFYRRNNNNVTKQTR
jgi:uncharacterized membrane protein HdeD (DUF308 family)